jgi:hypothetical protein
MVCAALKGIPYREFYDLLYYQKLIFSAFILTNTSINFEGSPARKRPFWGFRGNLAGKLRASKRQRARFARGSLV